ncbi:HD domain-containing protein [Blastopirellula sp. JC732]|uniref:HD domain-containing protein n=1 Tax=Blastopirellula sediminis TaxID=2894196 RepID=A0A9X1SKQ3_9BACT|nr:HD domain-containing protein [Blastopirellula sediminis]MCC9606674.1 HD domain-containing protein [Blastopirellula sediminis]MCC9630029.1 HD domain-containing protein [Blastopirellula sediminis]
MIHKTTDPSPAGTASIQDDPLSIYGGPNYHEREAILLAPYAMFSANTRGRDVFEADQPYRSPFQRDRDRVVHSSAYRRLSDKTQVFSGVSDYHRTRLTHTIEVASVARTMGRVFRLNEDLVEALAHLHDIGHPPYGHSGEDVLAECMSAVGGFSHNQFGLVLVDQLETRSPAYDGLNLTQEVLDSQRTRIDKSGGAPKSPLLEAQIVDAADSVTYDAHDVDDAVKVGLVRMEQVLELPLVRRCYEKACQRYGRVEGSVLRKMVVHELIDLQVRNVIENIGAQLAASQPQSSAEVQSRPPLVTMSEELLAEKRELEKFLYYEVYRHPAIVQFRERVQHQLTTMYRGYLRHPEWLPAKIAGRIDQWGRERAAGYYLATMTDTYCTNEFKKRFGES